MAVIREGGTDPGSQRGRKGGTKGTGDVDDFEYCGTSADTSKETPSHGHSHVQTLNFKPQHN